MHSRVAVLGGGSWGTALALHLAASGNQTSLWVHDPVLAQRMAATRENTRYLPGYPLPLNIRISSSLMESLKNADDVLIVVPSHHCRLVLTAARPFITGSTRFCVASKGIETDTLMSVSAILGDVLGAETARRTSVLSGPSFAQEVAGGHPTAVVIGTPEPELGAHLQRLFSARNLRAYTNDDLIGVELGGALKNIIAIGAGVVDGLGYGANTQAALITRGLAEISRLAIVLGGRRDTLAGLAGLGDLVLTCTGRLSRNRALGVALASGVTLAEHQAGTPAVAEGVRTTRAAWLLARGKSVEMPITSEVHALLYEAKPPAEAIKDLLARQLTAERDEEGSGSTAGGGGH